MLGLFTGFAVGFLVLAMGGPVWVAAFLCQFLFMWYLMQVHG